MKRFTIVQNGYNVEEVNRFIDIVIKRLEKLNNDSFTSKDLFIRGTTKREES